MKKLYYDFEVYCDFWLVVFKDDNNKRIVLHSRMNNAPYLARLKEQVRDIVFIGANNSRYDTLMLNYLLGYHGSHNMKRQCATMFAMSKAIIEENKFPKAVISERKISEITLEMDVLNFLTTGLGLKEIMARLHHPKLQSLPYPPNSEIKDDQIETIAEYCENDVDAVKLTVDTLCYVDMKTIWEIIAYFGLSKDVCCLTLGQLVEEALVDKNIKPNPPKKYRYKAPVDFNFKTQEFIDIEETYKGLILEPKSTFNLKTKIDDIEYSFGLGGVHAAPTQTRYDNLIDIDANQYYPTIMKNFDFLPNTIADKSKYTQMISDKERLGAEGDPRERSVKLGINIVFGKTSHETSRLYAPDKTHHTTITGQLLLLRLVEDLRLGGFDVVYVNTDGLMVQDIDDERYIEICDKWAKEFDFKWKVGHYKRVYFRDVNNYVALDTEGNVKRKGDLNTEPKYKASCFARVSTNAVVEHLLHGTNIREYINEANDLRDFLMYHKYNSNMSVYLQENGKFKRLPNVVRYVLSKSRINSIVHTKTEGGTFENRNYNQNVMLIPEFHFNQNNEVQPPKDLNREAYVQIAYDTLNKVSGQSVNDNPYIEDIVARLERGEL